MRIPLSVPLNLHSVPGSKLMCTFSLDGACPGSMVVETVEELVYWMFPGLIDSLSHDRSQTSGVGLNPGHHLQFVRILTGVVECVYHAEILCHRRRSEHLWTCPGRSDDNILSKPPYSAPSLAQCLCFNCGFSYSKQQTRDTKIKQVICAIAYLEIVKSHTFCVYE